MQRIRPLTFPCPTCKDELELRIGKNQKPYCICDRCGVQLFIRKAYGIRKLAEFLEIELNEEMPELSMDKNVIINFSQLKSLIPRYNQLARKIEEIEQKEDWYSINKSAEKEKSSIEEEFNNIKDEINKLAKNSLI